VSKKKENAVICYLKETVKRTQIICCHLKILEACKEHTPAAADEDEFIQYDYIKKLKH
jgi:hypothetical protein